MSLIGQALIFWRDVSVRLFFLNVSKTGIYLAAAFCLLIVLAVLWRAGALRKRASRLICAVVVLGLAAATMGEAAWSRARANSLLRRANCTHRHHPQGAGPNQGSQGTDPHPAPQKNGGDGETDHKQEKTGWNPI